MRTALLVAGCWFVVPHREEPASDNIRRADSQLSGVPDKPVAGCGFFVPQREKSPRTSNQQPATSATGRYVLLIALLLFAPIAFACPVCFGSPDDPMVKGVNNGIWVLLALVAVVQIGFGALFWNFWRRAREQRRFRESLHVIHSLDREGPFS